MVIGCKDTDFSENSHENSIILHNKRMGRDEKALPILLYPYADIWDISRVFYLFSSSALILAFTSSMSALRFSILRFSSSTSALPCLDLLERLRKPRLFS